MKNASCLLLLTTNYRIVSLDLSALSPSAIVANQGKGCNYNNNDNEHFEIIIISILCVYRMYYSIQNKSDNYKTKWKIFN